MAAAVVLVVLVLLALMVHLVPGDPALSTRSSSSRAPDSGRSRSPRSTSATGRSSRPRLSSTRPSSSSAIALSPAGGKGADPCRRADPGAVSGDHPRARGARRCPRFRSGPQDLLRASRERDRTGARAPEQRSARGGRRRSGDPPRRGARPRRRVGLRQDNLRRDHPAARVRHRGRDPLRRPGRPSDGTTGAAPLSTARADRLPGPVLESLTAPPRRLPSNRALPDQQGAAVGALLRRRAPGAGRPLIGAGDQGSHARSRSSPSSSSPTSPRPDWMSPRRPRS